MSAFFGEPSPWWHQLLMNPLYIAFMVFADEWLLRRNPHFGLLLSLLTVFVIPVNYMCGVFLSGSLALFVLFKCYLLTIPMISIMCWRLAHVREECAEGSARAKQRDKVMKHMPVSVMQWIESKFRGSDQLMARFLAVFLALNILEAALFECMFRKSRDGNYNWSAFFNAFSGILLIVSMPIPSASRCGLWYKIESEFSDMIWDFRLTDDNLLAVPWLSEYWSKQVLYHGWVLCYSLWDFEFITRFTGHKSLFSMIFHLGLPLLRTFIPDATDSGAENLSPLRYIQVRTHMLWLHLIYLNIWRLKVFSTSRVPGLTHIWDGNVLLALSTVSLLGSALYAYAWFYHFVPAFMKQKTANALTEDNAQTEDNGADIGDSQL